MLHGNTFFYYKERSCWILSRGGIWIKDKEYYKNHIDEFLKEFYGIELTKWQKKMLKLINLKEKLYFIPYRYRRY